MAKEKYCNIENYNSVFATRLRGLLEDNKVSLEVVAEYCGSDRTAVGRWKDGGTLPNIDKLKSIAEYFNVSSDYLLGLTDEKTTDKATKELCSTLGLSERSVEILSGGSNTVIATDTIERFSSIENNDEREDTIKKFIMFQTENIRFVLDKLVDDYIETYFSKEISLIDLLKSFYEAMAMSEEFVRFEDRETIKNKFLAVGEMNGCIVPFQIDIKNLLTDSAIGEISARLYSIKHNTMEEDKK